MPKSPTPTNHVLSGLHAICEVAKCCFGERLVFGVTVACGFNGVNGSLSAYLRSAGPELDVDEGIAVQLSASTTELKRV